MDGFIMENPIKNGWFGGATIFGNTQIEIKWATSATSPKLIFEIDDLACNAYFRAPAEAAAQRYLRSEVGVEEQKRRGGSCWVDARDFWGWCWKVFVKMSRKRNFWSTEKLFVLPRKLFVGPKVFFQWRWMTETLQWKKDSYALETPRIWQTASISTAELLSLCEKIETSELFWVGKGLLRGVSPCLAIMSCSVMVNLRVGWPWDTAFATIIDEYARDQGYHPSCYRLYAADRAVSRDMKLSRGHQPCLRFCPVPHERSGGPCHSPSVGACLHVLRVLHGRGISDKGRRLEASTLQSRWVQVSRDFLAKCGWKYTYPYNHWPLCRPANSHASTHYFSWRWGRAPKFFPKFYMPDAPGFGHANSSMLHMLLRAVSLPTTLFLHNLSLELWASRRSAQTNHV